jgi:hypothetical protein
MDVTDHKKHRGAGKADQPDRVGMPTTSRATVVAHGQCLGRRTGGPSREAKNDVVSTSAYNAARRPDVIH